MVDKQVILDEINNTHSFYYSLRGNDNTNFDINIDGIDYLGDKQLIELLKILKNLVADEIEKYS